MEALVKNSANAIKHYGSLDGLRSYAMICIIIMHVRAFLPYPKANVIGSFSSFVALFMMVSAFSLCCGYYVKIKNGICQPAKFYEKRYLRILPYFLFLCLLDFSIQPSIPAFFELFANSTLCFGLLPNSQMNMLGLGWFIGQIFLFYIMFPFYVFMIDNKRRGWIALTVSVIFTVICIAYFYKPPFVNAESQPMHLHNILYFMPFFLMGGVIYLYRESIELIFNHKKAVSIVFTVLVSVGYFIAVDAIQSYYLRFFLTLVVFSIWLMFAISTNSAILSNKVTRFLSKISLEMYLAQMFIFRGIQMAHLENYISNDTLLYILVAFFTVVLLIPFTYITKFYIVEKIVDKIIR